jgi:hypothetical protein
MGAMQANVRFQVELDAEVKKAHRRFTLWYRRLLQELARKVVARTPVITGRLKGGWYFSKSSSGDAKVQEIIRSDPVGAMRSFISKLDPQRDLLIYIKNGAPYASFVEFGTTKMSPRAMLSISILELAARRDIDVARSDVVFTELPS